MRVLSYILISDPLIRVQTLLLTCKKEQEETRLWLHHTLDWVLVFSGVWTSYGYKTEHIHPVESNLEQEGTSALWWGDHLSGYLRVLSYHFIDIYEYRLAISYLVVLTAAATSWDEVDDVKKCTLRWQLVLSLSNATTKLRAYGAQNNCDHLGRAPRFCRPHFVGQTATHRCHNQWTVIDI